MSTVFKFRHVELAAGKYQSLSGSKSQYSNSIEHVLHLDVANPVHAAEIERLNSYLAQQLEEMGAEVTTRPPYDQEGGTLKLKWGGKRHERIEFREKTGNSYTTLSADELPRLLSGSDVSVGVELWLRKYEAKDGRQGVSITAYPNVVVINSVAAKAAPEGPSKVQEETLAYLIDGPETDGDF